MADKVVLAYSGGLDTSVAIKWLEEKYSSKVVTLTVDIGNVPDQSWSHKSAGSRRQRNLYQVVCFPRSPGRCRL